MNLLGFFTGNPWRTACLVLLALVVYLHFLTVPGLEKQVNALTGQVAVDAVTIKTQNTAVTEWKQQASVAQAAQAKALEAANKVMVEKQNTVTTIMKQPIPTPDKECTATLDLLRTFQ